MSQTLYKLILSEGDDPIGLITGTPTFLPTIERDNIREKFENCLTDVLDEYPQECAEKMLDIMHLEIENNKHNDIIRACMLFSQKAKINMLPQAIAELNDHIHENELIQSKLKTEIADLIKK